MRSKSNQIFRAAAYLRISKEDSRTTDSRKAESESISNQRALIDAHVAKNADLTIVDYYVDDGYRGSFFERPAYLRMLSDITDGKVNCVIVKDLSRFAREYINAGWYLQDFFPKIGVRFIAINDDYDSLTSDDQTREIIIPFKNLINDAYCRDISIKIRSILEAKRLNGEFVSNFCPYGYKKCADDRNKIEPDEEAAAVVQDIFAWLIEGYSLYKVAEKLNTLGVKSPMDYRLEKGQRINTNFKKKASAEWSHNAVKRIAQNPVYIGTLIQGKVSSPNHKIRKQIKKDVTEWAVVEDNHEPLIDKKIFYIIQRLLSNDMRTAPKQEKVYMFSGIVFCGDCGAPMTRLTVPSGTKKYVYYICSNHKNHKACTAHRIKEDVLTEDVLNSLKSVISDLLKADDIIASTDVTLKTKVALKRLQERISANQAEIEKSDKMLTELYTDYKDDLISKEDFIVIKSGYENKKSAAKQALQKLQEEIEQVEAQNSNNTEIIDEFRKYRNIRELDRKIVACLIRQIKIYENKTIEIELDCQDRLKEILEKAEEIKALTLKEVV